MKPDMKRFKALWHLAVAIAGSEIIITICNFLVFNKITALLLALFGLICVALSYYIAKAAQTATKRTAIFACMLQAAVAIPLAFAVVSHLALQRETSFAAEIDGTNQTKISTYNTQASGLLNQIKEIKETEAKTAKIENSTASIIARNGGDPTTVIKKKPANMSSLNTDVILKPITPKIDETGKVESLKTFLPIIWESQKYGYLVLMFGSALLALFWQPDKNQNDIPDDEEPSEDEESLPISTTKGVKPKK